MESIFVSSSTRQSAHPVSEIVFLKSPFASSLSFLTLFSASRFFCFSFNFSLFDWASSVFSLGIAPSAAASPLCFHLAANPLTFSSKIVLGSPPLVAPLKLMTAVPLSVCFTSGCSGSPRASRMRCHPIASPSLVYFEAHISSCSTICFGTAFASWFASQNATAVAAAPSGLAKIAFEIKNFNDLNNGDSPSFSPIAANRTIALPRILSHSSGPLPISWLLSTTAASLHMSLSSTPKSNSAASTSMTLPLSFTVSGLLAASRKLCLAETTFSALKHFMMSSSYEIAFACSFAFTGAVVKKRTSWLCLSFARAFFFLRSSATSAEISPANARTMLMTDNALLAPLLST